MADEEVDWGVDEVLEANAVDAAVGTDDVLSLGGEEGSSRPTQYRHPVTDPQHLHLQPKKDLTSQPLPSRTIDWMKMENPSQVDGQRLLLERMAKYFTTIHQQNRPHGRFRPRPPNQKP
jgi:hypothetical protein